MPQAKPAQIVFRRDHPLAVGLVRAYLFSGPSASLADAVSRKSATITGAPTWGLGHYGRSLAFSGSAQHASATDAGLPMGSAPRTVAVLLRFTDTGDHKTVLSWGTFNVGERVNIYTNLGTIGADTWGSVFYTPAGVNDGRWHHVAVVMAGGTTTIYLDGRFSASAAQACNTVSSMGVLTIAAEAANDPVRPYNGELAGAWIWNRALPLGGSGGIAAHRADPFACHRLQPRRWLGLPFAAEAPAVPQCFGDDGPWLGYFEG